MKFGIDRLLEDPALRKPLAGRRVALLAHPASVTARPGAFSRRARGRRRQAHRGVRSAARPARRQAGQHDRVAGLQRPGARHPGVQPVRQGAPPDAGDDGRLRHPARRPAGPRLPRLHLPDDAALRARGGGRSTGRASGCSTARIPPAGRSRASSCSPGWESFVGAGRAADAPRADAGRSGALVRHDVKSRCGVEGDRDAGLEAGRRAGLRLAARRARLGEPEPERAEPVDGALLSGHGDAGRHDALGRPRHHAAAGASRRARPRRACAPGEDAVAASPPGCAAAGCAPAGSSRPSTSTPASSAPGCRSMSRRRATRTTRSGRGGWSALAFKALRALRPDYPLWRDFPYEYETAAADRRHQRRQPAAAMGRRSGGEARRPRCGCAARTKTPGATSARRSCSTGKS